MVSTASVARQVPFVVRGMLASRQTQLKNDENTIARFRTLTVSYPPKRTLRARCPILGKELLRKD